MVLTLDLREGLEEVAGSDPLAALAVGWQPSLADVVMALDQAGADERVAGLLVRLDGQGPGFAQLQELRDAVQRFRDQGKPAVAHADAFGELGPGNGGYYLASAFERIDLQPVGTLGLTGLILEAPLARGLLDKLGVLPAGDRRGAYKTIYDTFVESEMTPAHRESLQSLVGSLDEQLRQGLGEGRGLEPQAVAKLIDGGPYTAPEAQSLGLVDRLSYWYDTAAEMRDLAGEDGAMVDLLDYAAAIEPAADAPVVALVHGIGQIQRGNSEQSPLGGWVMGGDTVARALADAIEDADVEAILFRISSGGGSAVASDTIGRQVRRAVEQGKPVIVSMGDVAASGGYWIAMDASRIVAAPGTLTGSIGVVAGKPVLTQALAGHGRRLGPRPARRQRRHVDHDQRTTARAAAPGWKPFSTGPTSRSSRASRAAATCRRRRCWRSPRGGSGPGAQAKERGLVDDLGGFADALAVTRRGDRPRGRRADRASPLPAAAHALGAGAGPRVARRPGPPSRRRDLARAPLAGRAQHPADRDSRSQSARPA